MSEPELKALGRYTIARTLGKGAMGVVYEGLDPKLNRRVAIKTILKSHLDPDTAKDYSMRFSREAQAVARLNHPHIVQVYDFAEEGDIAYLVMEFIKGKELKNFFDANERFDIKEAVRIMCELLDALDFAHNAGIIHRDIKPANVMLDSQARTKLTDFGVARVQDVDRTHVERTQAGTMVGTPAYMSPEQITGGTIDKRTDVFSAGIILYQFLTGEKPFTGGGAWTIAKKIIQEDPPLPSSLNNAVTPFFDAVVNKALSKNADTRYQSAKEFAIGLKQALEGKGEEDPDKTIAGDLTIPAMPAMPARPQPRPAAAMGAGGTQTQTQGGSQEVELEFWRAIKDGNDPDDFELYIQQFPNGIYAALAKRKMAKLRGADAEETSAEASERRETEEAARREAEARAKLAEEKEKLELELAKKEEEFQQRDAARAEAEEKAKKDAEALAKKQAEERAKREAEFKQREAELTAQAAAGGKKSPLVPIAVGVVVLALAGGGYYFLAPDDGAQKKQLEAMQKQLEDAKKREEQARVAAEKAREAEAQAKKSGDLAKQKELAEARVRAEAEAKKQADLAKRSEADAKSARAAQEKSAVSDKARAEKLAAEKAAAERAAAERAAADKAQAAKLAQERAAAEKAIADAKALTERAAAERAAAEKAAAEARALSEKAAAERAAAEKAKTTVATAPQGGEALFEQATALEQQGKGTDAVKVYVRAARSGNGKAAKRLGEIYDKGIAGVSRDYAESLKWYNAARVLGEDVPMAKSR
jgi:eukaryotic-like serine/threonine-protein kinase